MKQYRKLAAATAALMLLSMISAIPANALDVPAEAETVTWSETESLPETTEAVTDPTEWILSGAEEETETVPESETAETTEETEETETVPEEDSTRAFVIRLYRLILNREPDSMGLDNWTSKLKNNELTAAEVLNNFINSKEYKEKNTDRGAYITMLYRTMLNREPDSAGYQNWYAQGQLFSRQYLLKNFIHSSEFTEICESYGVTRGTITLTESRDQSADVTRFIGNIYSQWLNREPDPTGLNTWTGMLIRGERSLVEVLIEFMGSQEFQQKNADNAAYVTSLYKGILGREPDAAGLQNWTNQLNTGKTRFSAFLGFVKSNEFKEQCANRGMSQYLTSIDGVSGVVITTGQYLMRTSPSYDSSSIGYVYNGQILTVTGIYGDWLRVNFQKQTAYIHKSHVLTYEGTGIKVLPVVNIPQCSNIGGEPLPTGCEVTSLAVLMNYLGFPDATKNRLAYTYMPTGDIGRTDPNYAFIGSPATSYSYGAFEGVMEQTARNYFRANDITNYTITNLGGSDIQTLFAQIDAGNPVLVWYTMNCTYTRTYGATWWLERGTPTTEPGTGMYSITWRNSEHCSVLVGYNRVRGTVVLADVWANNGAPTGALTEYSIGQFESAYNWLGKQAMTIIIN